MRCNAAYLVVDSYELIIDFNAAVHLECWGVPILASHEASHHEHLRELEAERTRVVNGNVKLLAAVNATHEVPC